MIWKCLGCVVKKKPVVLEAEIMYDGNSYCVSCLKEFVLMEESE